MWLGESNKVDLVLEEPLTLLLTRKERRNLKLSLQWQDPVAAPIKKGMKIGTLTVDKNGKKEKFSLLAGNDVAQLGIFYRFSSAINYLIFGAPVNSIAHQ